MVSLLYTLLFLTTNPIIPMEKYGSFFCSKRKLLKSSTEPRRSFWIWHLPFQPIFYQCSHSYKSLFQLHQITRISQNRFPLFCPGCTLCWKCLLHFTPYPSGELLPNFQAPAPNIPLCKVFWDRHREALSSVLPPLSAHLHYSFSD